MPTSKKSKSVKNIVSTEMGSQIRVYGNGLVKENKSTSRYGYVTTVHIFQCIFNHLYRYGSQQVEVRIGYGKTAYDTFIATKTAFGGFSVGCYRFDKRNAKKLFLLSGIKKSHVTLAFQKAIATAAGQ